MGDATANAIKITGIPAINYSIKTNHNNVEITIPNAYLHKSLADESYNWDLKLKNQLKSVYNSSVICINNTVTISIKFNFPVKITVSRTNKDKLTFYYEKINTYSAYSQNNSYAKSIDTNNIETLGTYTDNTINFKPSGKFVTISPQQSDKKINSSTTKTNTTIIATSNSKNTNINSNQPRHINKPDTSTQKKPLLEPDPNISLTLSPDNEDKIKNIPPDLPLPQPSRSYYYKQFC